MDAMTVVGIGVTGTEKHRLAMVGKTADWLVVQRKNCT
jgi:hypothetical protein